MILWLLLAINPVNTFPIELGEYSDRTLKMEVREHGVYLNTNSGLIRFDFKGNITLEIPTSPEGLNRIATYHVGDDFIWITDFGDQSSHFYDLNGKFLFKDEELFARVIQDMGNSTYLLTPGYTYDEDAPPSPFIHLINLSREPYPRMIQIFKIDYTPTAINDKTRVVSFYKASKKIAEKLLQFKKVWAFEDNGTYTVINQIENLSAIYTPAQLERERKVPLGQPFQARTASMNLPGFKEVPGVFEGKPFYRDNKDYIREALCWIWSQSTVVNIVPVPTGFVIGYLSPRDECNFGNLVIAKLNRNFRFQTVLVEMDTYGLMGEVLGDKVYVLVPNYKIENGEISGSSPEIRAYGIPP